MKNDTQKIPSCPSDNACSLINEFLETVIPITAEESYLKSFENLNITEFEKEESVALKTIFAKISESTKIGEFFTFIKWDDLDFSYSFKSLLALKTIKYLNTLGYSVTISRHYKSGQLNGLNVSWFKTD